MSAKQSEVIVERLKAPPFSMRISLVDLDKKTPFEIQNLLGTVVNAVVPDEAINIRNDGIEVSADRVLAVLQMLKFKTSADINEIKNGIVAGHKDKILPIIFWLLKRFDEHKKKAHLAKFLTPFRVPAGMENDRSIKSLLTQLQQAQEEFKEVHKEVEKMRSTGFTPDQIKADITAMERDLEHLTTKISRVKRKVESIPNFDHQLAVVSELRAERDQELQLSEQAVEQRNLLHHAEAKHTRTLDKLSDIRATVVSGNPEAVVQRQLEETNVNRGLCTERLPQLIREKEEYANQLTSILNQPTLSEGDFADMHATLQTLQDEVNTLTERKMSKKDTLADKNASLRQQVKIIAKKKETFADQLSALMDDKARLENQVREKERELSSIGERMLQGEELNRFRLQVKTKRAQQQRLEEALHGLTREANILNQTVNVLKEQCADVDAVLAKLEEEKGISGYTTEAEALEKAAAAKNKSDLEKEELGEDISKTVKEFNIEVQRRSHELAPFVQKLTKLRQEKAAVEVEWTQKKKKYDGVNAGLASERIQIEGDVKTAQRDLRDLENTYHTLQADKKGMGVMLARAEAEQASYGGGGGVSKNFASYKDAYQQLIEQQMHASRNLNKQKKRVKENHSGNMRQIEMLTSLERLLECKARMVEDALAEATGKRRGINLSKNRGEGGANVMMIVDN